MQRRLLYVQCLVLVVLVFLDVYLGIGQGFYWTIWWWDIPAHILGGLWAGLFGAWLGILYGRRLSVAQCMLFALAVGVGWEVFEYVAHIGGSPFMPYWIDTGKDLLDDGIGGFIAGLVASRMRT